MLANGSPCSAGDVGGRKRYPVLICVSFTQYFRLMERDMKDLDSHRRRRLSMAEFLA